MIPIAEWNEKYGSAQPVKRYDIFVDNMEPYESPVTGEVISNRRQRDYDLKATGSRPYEGFASEKREADKVRAEEDNSLRSKMMETAERTYYEFEHGYRR